MQHVVGCGTLSRAKAQQDLERRHKHSTPIETEIELIQVCLEMLVADAMMSAAEPGLQVPKHAMNVMNVYLMYTGHLLISCTINERS